jgi:hypothetical protein
MIPITLLLLVPTQEGLIAERNSNTSIMFRVSVGPRVQNRDQRVRAFFKKLTIRGNNNIVSISYAPVNSGLQYYNKQKRVSRRPLFWRFRREYP